MRHLQTARGTPIAGRGGPPAAPETGVNPPQRLTFAWVAALGLTLDVVSKIVVVDWLDPARPLALLGGLLTLRLIRNPGAAFSQGENFTVVFACAAIAVVVFVLARLAPRIAHRGWAVALGLLVAGVAGNLIDRIFRQPAVLRGHVVDFLQLPHFAIFNVADICITSAAVLIVILAVIKNVGIDGVRTESRDAKPAASGSSDLGRPSGSSELDR